MSSFIEIIDNYVKNYKKITLNEFIEESKNKLYPGNDIAFMEYFMELADEVNDYKFIVPHQKLFEFGIAVNTNTSNKIKERLDTLGLISGQHYSVADIRRSVKQGGNSIRKQYTLTPEAFKLCLLRAKKSNKENAVDPKIYAEYYMFIEKCILYYNRYEKQLSEAFSKIKDEKIDNLLKSNDDLKNQIAELMSYTRETHNKLDEAKIEREELLEKAIEAKQETSNLNTKLDKTNNILKKVKHMVNVPNTKDDDVTQYYTLLYDKSINQIKMVIGQKKYNSKKINQNINCTVEEFTYNPSPTSLKHATRKMIKDLPEKYSNKLTEINKIHNEKIRKYKRIIIKTNRDNILSENEKNDKIDICNSKIEHYTNIVNDNKNKYDIIINGLPLMNNSNIILNEWSYDEIKKLIRDCIDNQNDYDDVVVNEEDE